MSSSSDIRRANLKKKLEQAGGPSALARQLGISGPSYILQILSGIRPFSEKTARKWEARLGLKPYELDATDDGVPFEDVDLALLREVMVAVAKALEERKLAGAERAAKITSMVYSRSIETRKLDRKYLDSLIDLL